MRTWILLATATSALALAPSNADACSAPECWPGAFTPADGASVPANAPGFYWRPQSGHLDVEPDLELVTLRSTDAPEVEIPLTATQLTDGGWLLVPEQALAAGVDYTLTDANVCGTSSVGPSSTLHVGAAAALPTSLAAPEILDEPPGVLRVGTSSGSCSTEVLADQVKITIPLDSAAMPWRSLLHFETVIDGVVWRGSAAINMTIPPGESWAGHAVDRVYTVCASDDPNAARGLAPGPHEVTIRATLPGTTLLLESPPATFVLDCGPDDPGEPGDPGDPDEGGGCNAGGQASLLAGLALAALLRRRVGRGSR